MRNEKEWVERVEKYEMKGMSTQQAEKKAKEKMEKYEGQGMSSKEESLYFILFIIYCYSKVLIMCWTVSLSLP